MTEGVSAELFTPVEVAAAAGVPVAAVHALLARGEIGTVADAQYIPPADALRAARMLRAARIAGVRVTPREIFAPAARLSASGRDRGAFASVGVHAALLMLVVWLTTGGAGTEAYEDDPVEPAHMVFIMSPGPGGGGGGGGLRNPLPAPRVQVRGPARARLAVPEVVKKPVETTPERRPEPVVPTPAPPPVPKPVEQPKEPLQARVLVAPVAPAAPDNREREGVVEKGRADANSQGSGDRGGSGTGAGTGSGEGQGSGIGDGVGGGTGGGPFRPGSGIEPPRLIREVKADYTDEARRRNLVGEVMLEIVVRRDGSVGDITVLRGLGSGLDQRAVAAVRQWRFLPAQRKGVAVDVIVEVSVEFTLR